MQSPVQHYWSLAVEEQFYLVWPLLMLAIGVVAAKRWKLGAFVALGGITLASFVWSVMQTESNPATAYFVSTTRIWELGLGALLALSAARVARLPSVLLAAGGWLGIAPDRVRGAGLRRLDHVARRQRAGPDRRRGAR